jgi:hypothetical protein
MTVTKTHRPHRHTPHPAMHASRNAVVCMYCFQNIGVLGPRLKRQTVEARHICTEKMVAAQPAAPPPYN